MKAKLTLPLILIVFLIPLAVAEPFDMCEDTREINANCTMVTPVMNCTEYTYDIINLTGEKVVENATLYHLNESIYYFNLTVDEGDYVIRLCDDTTRQVRITEEGGTMIIGIAILLPLFFGLFMLIGSATMGREHNVLRIFMFLLSIIAFYTSLHFAMVAVVQFFNFPALENLIGTTTYWSAWVGVVIITYFIIYAFYKMIHHMAQKKKEELEY